ncbi:hypothetical protein J3R74_001400 [Puniceicoccus vermicola]
MARISNGRKGKVTRFIQRVVGAAALSYRRKSGIEYWLLLMKSTLYGLPQSGDRWKSPPVFGSRLTLVVRLLRKKLGEKLGSYSAAR